MPSVTKAGTLALLFALTSCREATAPEPVPAEPVAIGNQAVNCLKVDLGLPSEEVLARVAAKKDVVDLELLKRAHLPVNASDCEVRDFVDLVVYLSSNQRNYLETDPQVGMIRTAIQGREEQYLPMAKDWHSPTRYVKHALKTLLNENHKALVLQNFTQYTWLIEVINERGWAKSAGPEIVAFVEQQNGSVGYDFVRALASLEDPSLHPLMTKAFINGGMNRHITYSVLQKVEGFDTITPMKAIWESGRMNELEANAFAYPLLLTGYDAPIDFMRHNLDDYSRESAYRHNIDMMNALLGTSLTTDKMKAWLDVNRGKLEFKPELNGYRVKQ